jgi:hypothetical protein
MGKFGEKVFDTNFALDNDCRERVTEVLTPQLEFVRDDRMSMEDEWEKFFHMWNVEHDDHHTYAGRAKLYIPEVRKNVEAQARQLTEAAIPNDDFFEVSPGSGGSKKGALIRKSIARWQIEKMALRSNLHVYNRQNVMLGTSPVAILWNKKTNQVFRRGRNDAGKMTVNREMIEQYNGPEFVVRDLFRWYAMNPLAKSHKDDGCFEDALIGHFELLRKIKEHKIPKSLQEELLAAPGEAESMKELSKYIRRIEQTGIGLKSNQGYGGEIDLSKIKEVPLNLRRHMLTSVFCPMVLPEACTKDEDPECPIPVQIELVNGKPVSIRRNQFWHQQDPYLVGKYILPNADQFYGQGMPWALQYMQHELNSTAEQTMDSKTLALNPIALIDPALAAQLNDFEIAPAAKWFVNPNGVKFAAIPDLSGTGYQAMGYLRSQMQEYADRNPALPSQLAGKARSATQAGIVNDAVEVDLKAFQIQNEEMVLQPMLGMIESLTDQNIDDDQIIMILGRRASDWRRQLVKRGTALGTYNYFWSATKRNQNKPVQARQMIDMFKVIGSLPQDAQAALKFRWDEATKILWNDLLELPDGDKVIGSLDEMQAQDPEVEHKMLENGMELEVLTGDNDDEHLKKHDDHLKDLKPGSEQHRELAKHMFQHAMQKERKLRAQAAQQRIQQMMMQQMEQQAQAGQVGQGKAGGGMQGSGNRTQLSPNTTSGNMGSGVRA